MSVQTCKLASEVLLPSLLPTPKRLQRLFAAWSHLKYASLHAGRRHFVLAAGQNDEERFFKPAETDEEWLELDKKVNKYPCHRTFKAIGTGGKVNFLLHLAGLPAASVLGDLQAEALFLVPECTF